MEPLEEKLPRCENTGHLKEMGRLEHRAREKQGKK